MTIAWNQNSQDAESAIEGAVKVDARHFRVATPSATVYAGRSNQRTQVPQFMQVDCPSLNRSVWSNAPVYADRYSHVPQASAPVYASRLVKCPSLFGSASLGWG